MSNDIKFYIYEEEPGISYQRHLYRQEEPINDLSLEEFKKIMEVVDPGFSKEISSESLSFIEASTQSSLSIYSFNPKIDEIKEISPEILLTGKEGIIREFAKWFLEGNQKEIRIALEIYKDMTERFY